MKNLSEQLADADLSRARAVMGERAIGVGWRGDWKMSHADIAPRAYCVRDAAKYLNLSEATVFRKIKSGEIGARRLGRRTLITVEELDRFLAPTTGSSSQSRQPTTP
jgi:excisionase family DNA binding protein